MRPLLTALLLLLCSTAYAVDTKVENVDLPKESWLQLHKFKDNRIKALGYRPDDRQVVFVSEQPLSSVDVTELTQALLAFTPADTAEETKKKDLTKKSKLSVDELTELLRLKGVI